MTVGKALRQAQAGLDSIAGDCRAEVDRLLAKLDGVWGEIQSDLTAVGLQQVYGCAGELIGVCSIAGLPALDRVAYSLCDLVDRLPPTDPRLPEAVAVHMRSLHLLRRDDISRNATASSEVLKGLETLRDRLAPQAEAEAG